MQPACHNLAVQEAVRLRSINLEDHTHPSSVCHEVQEHVHAFERDEVFHLRELIALHLITLQHTRGSGVAVRLDGAGSGDLRIN